MKLSNTKAVITGGASGLGFACAQQIVSQGGSVTLLDINEDTGQQALKDLNTKNYFVKTDVSNENNVEQAIKYAYKSMGGLNLAINCAGVLSAGRVLGRDKPMASDYFSQAINVNLVGSFNVCKFASALMQENNPDADGQRGVLINTASVAAYEGQIGQAAYSASKAGIIGMTLPMAREFTRIGVRVMTIAPGVFMTPMVSGMPDHVKEALAANVPFPSRLGEPQEFAKTVEHIVENTYLNGSVIRLDGAIRLEPK